MLLRRIMLNLARRGRQQQHTDTQRLQRAARFWMLMCQDKPGVWEGMFWVSMELDRYLEEDLELLEVIRSDARGAGPLEPVDGVIHLLELASNALGSAAVTLTRIQLHLEDTRAAERAGELN